MINRIFRIFSIEYIKNIPKKFKIIKKWFILELHNKNNSQEHEILLQEYIQLLKKEREK